MPDPKLTAPELRARKGRGPKIAMVTAYDATLARLLDEGGADVLLVGDSLGMVVQGHPNTLSVTLDEMIYHSRAVARGARRAQVVVDMPFMSFQVSPERALEAAGRLVKEGSAEAVKLEGGVALAETVRRIVGVGIPVMGHVGLTPQSVHAFGGFRVQGKTDDAAARVLEDARALEAAGAYAVVLEALPVELARRITAELSVPTIGIGAGPDCDGQVLVCYDLLGMYRDMKPKFVKRYAELGDAIVAATAEYVGEVRSGTFPTAAHGFGVGARRAGAEATGTAPVVAGPPASYGPASEE
ncbi:MAG: 3-methyl-2-oxobutanoate hydroxymethyltransferase [Deltaproteobacteria bacterium]|nr:3-methyl-2-oxobutanoate hydroxymethyltransferase [Deltaproteobacteria bacterium]